MADEDLAGSADQLNSSLSSVISKLQQMNSLVGSFSTKLQGTADFMPGGRGGGMNNGNTGSGNGIGLGTDGAQFYDLTAESNRSVNQGNASWHNATSIFNGIPFLGPAISGVLNGVGDIVAGGVKYANNNLNASMPNMQQTISRAGRYYNATLMGNEQGPNSRMRVERGTMRALGNGLSGVGSDVEAANAMIGSGIQFSNDYNSTYQSNMRNVGNTARYLNIDNGTAAASLAGLTSGASSSGLMQMGIMTSDPHSGKMLSEAQIFQQFYQRATAGRPKASVADTMDSLHRGFLGQMIQNSGLDSTEQAKLAQYFIDKAQGQNMDLSNNAATGKLIGRSDKRGNKNPLDSQMMVNTAKTNAMTDKESGLVTGFNAANSALKALTETIKNLNDAFVFKFGFDSTFKGDPAGRAASGTDQDRTNGGPSNSVNAMAATGGYSRSTGGGIGGPIGSSIAMGASGSGSYGVGSGTTSSVATASVGKGKGAAGFKLIRPVSSGKIGAFYNSIDPKLWNGPHRALDFWVSEGTPVYAAADGTVVTSVNSSGEYGYHIIIDHGNGYQTVYAHLSLRMVENGSSVAGGSTMIGKSGSTGKVTGPHLHFELRKNGTKIDPLPFMTGVSGATTASATSGSKSSTSGASATAASAKGSFASGAQGSVVVQTGVSGISAGQYSIVSNLGGPSNTGMNIASVSGAAAGGGSYTGGMAGISSGGIGARSGNNVTINLSIAQASETEARKFANLIKRHLEEDALMTNIGTM
jgi:murein DD-endopeptidase MepM/ murein hydrolase activator NlpD